MEIVKVNYLGTVADYQDYSSEDKALITSAFINSTFGQSTDYIECFIYDLNGNIISRNYNMTDYTPSGPISTAGQTYNAIQVDPEKFVKSVGIDRGSVNVRYNFLKQLLRSSPGVNFWIKEVSSSRTEIKVARQDLSDLDLLDVFTTFNNSIKANPYYPDFYLNFGDNEQILAVNAVYVEEADGAYIIFKLYEPLPNNIDVKSQFWVVEQIAEAVEYRVDISVETQEVESNQKLRGPNYNVELNQKAGQTTGLYSYESLFGTTVTSSFQQIKSWMDEKGVDINVDYSSFSNFIHFSSAEDRLYNFTYKVGLIESYSADLASLSTVATGSSTNTIVSSSKTLIQANINNVIEKFDGYEYYLYFTSASSAWPKSNSTVPYNLYSITSSQAINWLGNTNITPTATTRSMVYSASYYDDTNKDYLPYTMPAYLRDDSDNEPYFTFLNMIGQHFDNIWIYYKDLSNRYSSENNPEVGISMDVVSDALRAFGVQLYTNTSTVDSLYYSILGINPDGGTLPYTGSEDITNYVTSSLTSLPSQTIVDEYYKRMYHNLPYLLKTRGTQRGIKALISTYGIPASILTVNEFGGYNIYAESGIQSVNNEKVSIPTVSEISGSLLSAYTTIQAYSNNTERNSIGVEIGFSPADSINNNIISSSFLNATSSNVDGVFNINQYIGNPALQYSSSYEPLVTLSKQYFSSSYTSGYDVNDFTRVIKYYNNTIFKTLRDWVPARASVSTGIIIKSHILERNRYERHEPTGQTSSYEDTIVMLAVTGSNAPNLSYPTTFSQSISTLSGSINSVNTYQAEPFTGEFGGTEITVTSLNSVGYQTETSDILTPGSTYRSISVPIDYLINNVSGSVLSEFALNEDYNTSQLLPSNYGLITRSLDAPTINPEDRYNQLAELQDYNYYKQSTVRGRYSGSKLESALYNDYTEGDNSYGTAAAIDIYNNYFAKFTYITSSGVEVAGTSKVFITELIDVNGNTYPLGDNKHIQDIARTFKKNTEVVIYNLSAQTSSLTTSATVVEGGGYYQVILFSTASINNYPPTDPYPLETWNTIYYTPYQEKVLPVSQNKGRNAFSASGNILYAATQPTASSSTIKFSNWLYPFLTSSFTTQSVTYPLGKVRYEGGYTGVYNTNTNTIDTGNVTYVSGNLPPYFPLSGNIDGVLYTNFQDIVSPIKANDYIILGNIGSDFFGNNPTNIAATASSIYQITSTNIDAAGSGLLTGSLTVGSTINPLPNSLYDQAYMIYRKIDSDNYITINETMLVNSFGLIIPNNFNPAYDPLKIAREVGILI